jgi:S-layer protein (TIGR01564 family)
VNGTYYAKAATVQPKSLVISDVEAEGSDAYLIVVGGPWVNRIAAGMADSSLTTEVGAQNLIATDKKLLAAGYSATDTAAAADELIDLLVA